MAIYRLEETQVIQTDPTTCWKFFSSARNLTKITPSNLGFEILSDLPEEVYPGLFIEYQVKPLLGIPMTWVTEITHVRGPHYFCDEQRVGPYRIWHHEHFFRQISEQKIEVRDLVHYQLPLSPCSDLFHPLLVAPRLKEIFSYRRVVLEELFPNNSTT